MPIPEIVNLVVLLVNSSMRLAMMVQEMIEKSDMGNNEKEALVARIKASQERLMEWK